MKIKFLLILVIAFSVSAFFSCRKEKDAVPEPGTQPVVTSTVSIDSVVGSYLCNISWTAWTMSAGTSSGSYVDTITVSENAVGELFTDFYNKTFTLDGAWAFTANGPTPHQEYDGQFNPAQDSVKIHYKNGGMGGHSTYNYNGIKL